MHSTKRASQDTIASICGCCGDTGPWKGITLELRTRRIFLCSECTTKVLIQLMWHVVEGRTPSVQGLFATATERFDELQGKETTPCPTTQ